MLQLAVDARRAARRRARIDEAAVAEAPGLRQRLDQVARDHHRALHVAPTDALELGLDRGAQGDLHESAVVVLDGGRRVGDDEAQAQSRRGLAGVVAQRQRGPECPFGVVAGAQQRAKGDDERLVVVAQHQRVALERHVARQRDERPGVGGALATARPRAGVQGDEHHHHALPLPAWACAVDVVAARVDVRGGRRSRAVAHCPQVPAAAPFGPVVLRDEVGEHLVVDHGIGIVQPRGQLRLQRPRPWVALVRIAGQAAIDDRGELGLYVGHDLGQRRHWIGAHLFEGGEAVLGSVEQPAGDQLVQHDPQRVDVRARIDRTAVSLLGGHVRDLALDGLGGAERAGTQRPGTVRARQR